MAVDTTPFWRPKLKGWKSKYYNSIAEKALPAVILGLVVRIGEVADKRFALPCSILRVDPKDPSEAALKKELLSQMSRTLNLLEIMLVDAGFKIKACTKLMCSAFCCDWQRTSPLGATICGTQRAKKAIRPP